MKNTTGQRILKLIENNPFPPDPRIRQQVRALVAAGYEVTVICPQGKRQPLYEMVDGCRVYRYPTPAQGDGLVGYLWEYGYSLVMAFLVSLWVFFRHGFDAIHIHNPPDVPVLIAAFYKLLGKRYVFDHHDLAPEMYYARFSGKGNPMVYKVLLMFEKLSCKLADHIIATNNSYKTLQMDRHGVAEERITIVRNGPELDRLKLVPPHPDLRRKASNIICFLGEMGVHDGVDYLLRSLKHLRDTLGQKDFYCVVMGRGDAVEDLKRLCSQLELNDHVWFPGFVPDADLLSYVSTADICVDPDPSNSFNDRCSMTKMSEYMAFSKPIVAFDLPEHRVTAREAALYAVANDELDFARKLQLLMENPEMRLSMGKLGRERVDTVLSWSHQSKYLIQAYEQLFSRKHPRIPQTDGVQQP